MCCAIQDGCTVLHRAARYGRMAVVKCLVEECHAVITTQDKGGQTPIDYAKSQGRTSIVHYLKARIIMKMIMESEMLPFYRGVRGIIVKYLQ